ncbi:glycoside hydrolase family 36 protein [Cellulophaga sp. Z1A5H]|uniref:glycoside hydrolase family 36 protein n=1 Tax=Cellulophaga sp. Z1A5H TaxID=2687291 RepID=UPI0013FDBD6C|nr:glycoside hydrolase family 36 protein [Cellulophaga sp. Z1A5H]
MKMHKKLLIKNLILSSFIFVLLISCNSQEASKKQVLKIENEKLVFEIDSKLYTKISTSLPEAKLLMGDFQSSENITIGNTILKDFEFKTLNEKKLEGPIPGKEWVVTGLYEKDGLKLSKELILRLYDNFPDLISTQVTYTNESKEDVFVKQWVNNSYTISSKGDEPLFWAFQGSSTTERSDWVTPLEEGYYKKNYMGMNDTDYGSGIPVTSVWRPDVNIAVGHLALVPKMVSLPTEVTAKDKNAFISVLEDYEERTPFKAGESITTLETFVSVSKGDYYANLSRYSNLMQAKGIKMVETEDEAFEPIWCAWGYERKFTLDEIVKTLPKVKELGIKWAVLDDGFQIAEGDWDVDPKKFPKGNIEIKELVDDIHSYGLKAKIWWTPLAADPHSKNLQEHPEMMVVQKDGSPQFITWWNAYYLSPTKEETINHTKKIITLFMKEWGFDGLKMDGQHMNAVAPDYTLDNPNDSFEGVPAFFQMIYDEARSIKPNAVVENCPCGACMSFFNMPSMNQAVSSDPTSSWQVRHKGKTYKALVPHTAYYGDHVELSDNANDFATSFGIGAVLGTKFTWPKDNPDAEASYLLTPEKEVIWKKWFSLYNEKMLSKEPYLGNLYDIGYDKPETHVITKDGNVYYAFYADDWNGKIAFRGLQEGLNYTIKDYFNDKDLGTISSDKAFIEISFKDYLLIEATPIQ